MKELLDELAELLPSGKDPPQVLRQRLLGNATRPRLRFAPLFGKLSGLFDLDDMELAALFERASNADEWVNAPVAGVRLLHLSGGPRVAQADNGLARMPAGTSFPRHRHLGSERVLVLEGAYQDSEGGRIYRAGDMHDMAAGSSHSYTALSEGDLLLAVSLLGGVDVDGYEAFLLPRS